MVGAGNMGGAMIRGWIQSGIALPERLAACVRKEDNAVPYQDMGMQVNYRAIHTFHGVACTSQSRST
jgi:pyrroline-5-carboxylate reductase